MHTKPYSAKGPPYKSTNGGRGWRTEGTYLLLLLEGNEPIKIANHLLNCWAGNMFCGWSSDYAEKESCSWHFHTNKMISKPKLFFFQTQMTQMEWNNELVCFLNLPGPPCVNTARGEWQNRKVDEKAKRNDGFTATTLSFWKPGNCQPVHFSSHSMNGKKLGEKVLLECYNIAELNSLLREVIRWKLYGSYFRLPH